MGLIDSLLSGGIQGLLGGIGGLARDIKAIVTGKLDPEKQAELDLKLMEMEFVSQQAQTQINLEEAKHQSLFVSGWRPATGWCCALGLGYHYILFPLMNWIATVFYPSFVPPVLDTEGLITLLLAMLGMGGLRTYEKLKGVNRN